MIAAALLEGEGGMVIGGETEKLTFQTRSEVEEGKGGDFYFSVLYLCYSKQGGKEG